jgi:hypothetical protein
MAEGQTFPAEHFRDQIVSELEDDRLLWQFVTPHRQIGSDVSDWNKASRKTSLPIHQTVLPLSWTSSGRQNRVSSCGTSQKQSLSRIWSRNFAILVPLDELMRAVRYWKERCT